MMRIFGYIAILAFVAGFSIQGYGQNVTGEEEAYLKEFDLYSFKDAGIKVKDSTLLYQHLIGVKWGYAMSNVKFSQSANHKGITSTKNIGIYYTYFHSMLGNMPYFGMQIGLESTEFGYTHVTEVSDNIFEETEQRYSVVDVPLISLFRYDVSRIRLMLGAGGYGSYIYDTSLSGGVPETTNKFGFGLMGQGGIAIKFHPIEIHLEASYKYGLTHFFDPKIYSEQYWLYTHQNQLQFMVGLQYNLGGKYFKRKK